jgi:hypothetical protein
MALSRPGKHDRGDIMFIPVWLLILAAFFVYFFLMQAVSLIDSEPVCTSPQQAMSMDPENSPMYKKEW